MRPAFVLATFLHPQFKLLQSMNLSQTSKDKVHDYVLDLMYESYDSEKNDDREKEVTDDSVPAETAQTNSLVNFFQSIINANKVDSDDESECETRKTCKQELEGYIKEKEKTIKDFDVLAWWKGYEDKFPRLALLAKKYLSIQATSAPSERIFSKAGRIIDEQRTRLNSEIAGNLLYVAMNYSWHKKRKTQDGES